MKKIFIFLLIPFFIMGASFAKEEKSEGCTDVCHMKMCPHKAVELRGDLRKLWEDHITYIRNYIISALAGLPDVTEVKNRLIKNQESLGEVFKPYYGNEAVNCITSLLKDHIKITTEVVKAAKERNRIELEKADKKWHKNADDIASALNGLNSNWKKQDLKDMLYHHLKFISGQVTSRVNQEWKKDIDYYDKGHEHILKFADVITKGIVEQFPKKFESE